MFWGPKDPLPWYSEWIPGFAQESTVYEQLGICLNYANEFAYGLYDTSGSLLSSIKGYLNFKEQNTRTSSTTILGILSYIFDHIIRCVLWIVTSLCAFIYSHLLVTLIIVLTSSLFIYYTQGHRRVFNRKVHQSSCTNQRNHSVINEIRLPPASLGYHLKKYLLYTEIIFGVAILCSIPWEFYRQYQLQYAKQAAITLKGLPEECDPHNMTYVGWVRRWVTGLFSWSTDRCVEYHQALLVHPLWQISPVAVITGALSRIFTAPVLIFSELFPQALRNIFSELPLHWQPIILVILVVFMLLCFFTRCRYRIRLPFLSIEPASPITCYQCVERRQVHHRDVRMVRQVSHQGGDVIDITRDNSVKSVSPYNRKRTKLSEWVRSFNKK